MRPFKKRVRVIRIIQMTLFSKAWAMRSIHLGSGRTLSGLSYDNIYDDEA